MTDRPIRELPLRQLIQLSTYWLGINMIWGGLDLILQPRMNGLWGAANAGSALAVITVVGKQVKLATLLSPIRQPEPPVAPIASPLVDRMTIESS